MKSYKFHDKLIVYKKTASETSSDNGWQRQMTTNDSKW